MNSFKSEQEGRLFSEAARLERRIAALKKDHGAELALDAYAIEYQQKHPDVPYSTALEVAMQENKDLAAEYVASFGAHKVGPEQARSYGMPDQGDADAKDSPATSGKEIDRLALKMQRENLGWSYEKCLQRVLEEHPELKKAYAANR
jgi:hypothetical protein